MKKRLLSLAIAICMVVAMLPSVVISAGAETADPYRFIYGLTPFYYNHGDYWSTIPADAVFSKTGGSMKLNSSYNISGYNGRVGSFTEISCATGSWIAFDFNVPIAGTYDVVLKAAQRGNGAKGTAYILPGNTDLTDIEAAKSKGIQMVQAYTQTHTSGVSAGITTMTPQPGWGTERDFSKTNPSFAYKEIYFDAGIHTVLIYCTEASSSNYLLTPTYIRLTTSGITETTETTFTSAYTGVVEVANATIPVGGTTTASAYIMNLPTAEVTVQTDNTVKSGYTFTSSDPTVASVDSSTGIVTAKAAGKATISATLNDATKVGNILSTEVEVYGAYEFAYFFGAKNGTNTYNGDNALSNNKLTNVTYGETAGMWKYYAGAAASSSTMKDNFVQLATTEANPWVALMLNVPESGSYNISAIVRKVANGPKGSAYLLKATQDHEVYFADGDINDALADPDLVPIYEEVDFSTVDDYGNVAPNGQGFAKNNIPLEKGEYILIFNKSEESAGTSQNIDCLFLRESRVSGSARNSIQSMAVILDNLTVEAGKTANAKVNKRAGNTTFNTYRSVGYDVFTFEFITEDVTYSSSNTNVAEVNEDTGAITAKNAGTTVINATLSDGTVAMGATLTVTAPEEDEQFTNEFTGENGYTEDETKAFTEAKTKVNFYSAVVGGTVEMNETTLLKADTAVPLGTQYSYTAPTKEGYTFRYWAKALSDKKLIVTRNATVEFMPTTEVTNLVAVYEPENSTATVARESFYNANGQLLTDVSIESGKMPPLPSMAGYGTASKWVQYGNGAEFVAGQDAPTENLMFVAKYAEPTTLYAIDVVDGTGKGSYTYGTEVICKATVPEGKVFKCWTKTVGEVTRIISLDEEYTFNVWEACKLTAVFADEEPVFTGNKFSIILSTMAEAIDGNTAYMAEFVGLEDAVEKGIAFGTKRVAMTTDAAQFTVVDDIGNVDVTGYAILSDGTVIYDK
ncbi:MAG: Ig-like domain-containing protein [Oscillospiraceae bacterium]|nr:Ig-like domain-containing protein [Oscillospiraceae bacterium]